MMGGNADTRPREERLHGKTGACRSRLGDWIKRDEETEIGKTRPCVFFSTGYGNTIRHDMMDGWMDEWALFLFFVFFVVDFYICYSGYENTVVFLGIGLPSSLNNLTNHDL
jgi:hypothetical protein